MSDSRLALAKLLLPRLLEGDDDRLPVLRAQLEQSSVRVRRDTNWGFFADVSVPQSVARLASSDFCGGDAQIEVKGLCNPAGCLLYVEDGALSYLEVFTFDEPWEPPPVFGEVLSVVPIIPGENVTRSDKPNAPVNPDAHSSSLPPVAPSVEGAYSSANVLLESEHEGWLLGLIGTPWPGPWPKLNGDLFILSPDGWQAGLAWESHGPDLELISGPHPSRWGVYQVRFPLLVMSQADLVRNFHAVLPLLQAEYERVKTNWSADYART